MRIIAGKYKGRKLLDFKGDNIRPTTDRVKETIFNIIQFKVPNAKVIDLFAGTGALGIEAMSRGADEVTLIDSSQDSINLIKSNIAKFQDKISIVKTDARLYLSRLFEQKDIFFIDPPYKSELGIEAIKTIIEKDLLSKNGVIVYEHSNTADYSFLNKGYKVDMRKMGSVQVDFIYNRDIVMFPGSFDPITVGHVKIVENALTKYDEVLVAMLINETKKYDFDKSTRLEALKAVFKDNRRVEVVFFDGFAYELAREYGINKFIRGIRNEKDKKYEDQVAEFNAEYDIETEYIDIGEEYRNISSTDVKNEMKRSIFTNLPENAKIILLNSNRGE